MEFGIAHLVRIDLDDDNAKPRVKAPPGNSGLTVIRFAHEATYHVAYG